MYLKLELLCQWQQSHRHTSVFTVFGSSDGHVLLPLYPAELK